MKTVLYGLLTKYPDYTIQEVFSRIAPLQKLQVLREGLKLFMNHFLLRSKTKELKDTKLLEELKEKITIAENALGVGNANFMLWCIIFVEVHVCSCSYVWAAVRKKVPNVLSRCRTKRDTDFFLRCMTPTQAIIGTFLRNAAHMLIAIAYDTCQVRFLGFQELLQIEYQSFLNGDKWVYQVRKMTIALIKMVWSIFQAGRLWYLTSHKDSSKSWKSNKHHFLNFLVYLFYNWDNKNNNNYNRSSTV